jgi:hypothetical protein
MKVRADQDTPVRLESLCIQALAAGTVAVSNVVFEDP